VAQPIETIKSSFRSLTNSISC